MRSALVVLVNVLLLLVGLVGRSDAVHFDETAQISPSDSTRESKAATTNQRFLRGGDKPISTTEEEDRDITLGSIVIASAKAVNMRNKLNIMLARGLSPTRVLKKLGVVRMSDKNFNNFARFYARYLAKYSGKKPNLPKTAEDVIVLPKMKDWLAQELLPFQVEQNLKNLASRNVNRYMKIYFKDADNIIILPRLERWESQRLLPSQFKNNLIEIGVKDTTKYTEWYMRNGGDEVVMTKLRKWLQQGIDPADIGAKLRKIGVTDTAKYVDWYIDAPVVARLKTWVNRGLYSPQILVKLKRAGVTDIKRYSNTITDLYGQRQAMLYRKTLP
ncbi:hypothetical protein P3T76_011717 [Phytophthora citrophthora]|uniref:RxLR effector protein n=1 Tax=Phytophthora citrophthora TaxID=4793 RepID=A0AAD9G8U2_9STRA|nr:hypothetical protein P3T76_011717 [Phytophthora citrophthora]